MNRSFYLLSRWVKKNLPTILTFMSIVSTAGALYFTGKATIKAVRTYDKLKKDDESVSKKDVFKAVVPYYIPAAGFAAASIALSLGSNHIHVKRQQVLAGALLASNEALQQFRKKVGEQIGEEKMKEITDLQAKEAKVCDSSSRDPQDQITVFDQFAYFKFQTTWTQLNNAMFEVNRRLNCHDNVDFGIVRYEDFYRWMGVNLPSNLKAYGWDSVIMLDSYDTSWVDFFMRDMQDSNGLPITILEYSINPTVENKYR